LFAGETDFTSPDTHPHHSAYRLPKARLHGFGRSLYHDPTSPVGSTGNPYSHYKTHEEYQDRSHDSHQCKIHRRYQSADASGVDLGPTSGPAYQVRPSHLLNLQDTQSSHRKRSDSCGSTDAVVGSPHVHFSSGVSGQRVNVFDSSHLPRRRRTRVTEEINHLLGPDSGDEDKGEGELPSMFLPPASLSIRFSPTTKHALDYPLYRLLERSSSSAFRYGST
jgi:hypothetical protein